MKARKITSVIEGKKDSYSRIIVFTGARQVGKTTCARNILPEYDYLSIEDPIIRKDYLKLTAAQWNYLYPKAILDEIQKEPQLMESIKSVYDQYDSVRYLLLGSSQLTLLKQVKESLAGRCVLFDLYPLTLPELCTKEWNDSVENSLFQELILNPSKKLSLLPSFNLDKKMPEKDDAWRHYMKYGGYPILTQNINEEERFEWLRNYVRTYLERDVRDLASFRDLQPFIKLQQALAVQTGCIINASELGGRIGMSAKTVQRYIQYLELSYQTITLPAWDRNKTKRLTKAPKIHYLDNGVLQAILQKRGNISGHEYESLVIAELFKQAKNIQSCANFYHLRTQDGKEIDLIIETQDGYFAFEIKQTEAVNKSDIKHFRDLETLLDKPLIHAFVLSDDRTTTHFSENITSVNAAMFLG